MDEKGYIDYDAIALRAVRSNPLGAPASRMSPILYAESAAILGALGYFAYRSMQSTPVSSSESSNLDEIVVDPPIVPPSLPVPTKTKIAAVAGILLIAGGLAYYASAKDGS
jgi:hypothetical protein